MNHHGVIQGNLSLKREQHFLGATVYVRRKRTGTLPLMLAGSLSVEGTRLLLLLPTAPGRS